MSGVSAPDHGVRSFKLMNNPPPCSTNRFSRSVVWVESAVASFNTTTDRRSKLAGVTREAGTTSVLKGGAVPIESTVVRK